MELARPDGVIPASCWPLGGADKRGRATAKLDRLA